MPPTLVGAMYGFPTNQGWWTGTSAHRLEVSEVFAVNILQHIVRE